MCQFKNQLANLRSAASVVAYDDDDDRVNTARISHKSHGCQHLKAPQAASGSLRQPLSIHS